MAFTRLARVFIALFRASSEYSSSIFEDSNLSPVKPMRQGSSDIVDEINAYIGCPKIMPPILAILFRALKTIPPSSIEAERAFSKCGQFATRPRSRLNDDTLNALHCGYNWHQPKMKCTKNID